MRQIYEEFLMEVVQDSIYIALLKSYKLLVISMPIMVFDPELKGNLSNFSTINYVQFSNPTDFTNLTWT